MEGQFFLLAAGSNAQGQLAIGHVEDAHEWTPTLCLCADDDREGGGESSKGSSTFPPAGFQVVALVGGANHSLAILEDRTTKVRTLWGAGDARKGQLGPQLQNTQESCVPAFAQLEPEGSTSSSWSTRIKAQDPIAIAAAWESSYVALQGPNSDEDDFLLSLGNDNDFGQLGIGSKQSTEETVHRVDLRSAIRTYHQDSGRKVAEQGSGGRLKIVSVEAGVRHVCAVVRLQRAGGGSQSEPDDKSTTSPQYSDQDIISTFLIGWGAARHGQLARRWIPTQAQTGTSKNVERAVWLPRVIDAWDGAVDVQVSCGRDHTVCMVKHDATKNSTSPSLEVFTLGSNRQSQSPSELLQDPYSDTIQIAAMWNTTLLLSGPNTVRVWGAASRGQSGSSAQKATVEGALVYTNELAQREGARIASLMAGSEHAIVKVENGSTRTEKDNISFWAWGWTEHGNIPAQLEPDHDHGLDGGEPGEVFEQPVQIWPSGRKALECTALLGDNFRAVAVWAGCATTFIQVQSKVQS